MSLETKLTKVGSALSMNNGGGYAFPGRSDAAMTSDKGTIHNAYSVEGIPTADKISPTWIGQFGATINTIPTTTSQALSGNGTVDQNPYTFNLPT